MKIAVLIARILLGVIFVFFGLNGFLNFLHAPLPGGTAGQFLGALFVSHYVVAIAAFQILGGVLLFISRFIPLGLTILGPIVVNILLFHLLLTGGAGIVPGAVCTVLELFLIVVYRRNFLPLLAMNPEADTTTP